MVNLSRQNTVNYVINIPLIRRIGYFNHDLKFTVYHLTDYTIIYNDRITKFAQHLRGF
ncbi:hypothetical protein [Reinekea sp.]|jgi:hypothetical protein|uniref:hypothetical protein n=1 Tax=Reinekea sp. TaxID=1970455 RepID=UPI0039899D78